MVARSVPDREKQNSESEAGSLLFRADTESMETKSILKSSSLKAGLFSLDRVLRPGECTVPPSIGRVSMVVVFCGVLYGVVMGSYAMCAGHRTLVQQLPQMIYSATKVPILLSVTVGVALPSFFVLNSLLGLREDFRESVQGVVAAQAGMTIILLSIAPLTLFVYAIMEPEGKTYQIAVMFNAFAFGLSSVAAQLLLRRYYAPLVARNPRHRMMMKLWILVYAFVGIQCAYILRPFIGDPTRDPSWLRADSFQNAYVKIFQMVVEIFR